MTTPRIFISHSHHDQALCRRVHGFLKNTFPNATIFYDESELHGGDDWLKRIQFEVIAAPIFILILSQHSVVAPWVQEETNQALRETVANATRKIIPLRAEATLTDDAIKAFAPFILGRQVIPLFPDENAALKQLAAVVSGQTSDKATVAAVGVHEFERALRLANDVQVAVEAHQWLLAMDLGERAVTLPGNENNAGLWKAYAQALVEEGELEKASVAVGKGLQVNPGRNDLWQLQAEIQGRQQATEEAILSWRNALLNTSGTAERLAVLSAEYAAMLPLQVWPELTRIVRMAQQMVPHDTTWAERKKELDRAQEKRAEETERQRQAEIAKQRGQAELTEQRRREAAAEEERRMQALITNRLPDSLKQLRFAASVHKGGVVIAPPVITIPAGAFLMGSDKRKDPQALDREFPQQTVTLGMYGIAQYPLTVAEYACAVGQTFQGQTIAEPLKPSYNNVTWQKQLQHPDHPVVNISWNDAMRYSQWLAQVTGQQWRLPTEAEWEKAARGPDGLLYPYGNTFDASKGNTENKVGTTTPVGSYPQGASPYGVFDCSGNVWEWTSSIFKLYPYQANDGRENLTATESRVMRGGSWGNDARATRAAYRDDNTVDNLGNGLGVRLAVSPAG